MTHPYSKEAKDGHSKKLASYGGRSKGDHFTDKGSWDGVPPVDSGKVYDMQRVPTRKAGGRVDGAKSEKRLDKAPRSKTHPDEAADKKLISKMIKADDKRHERASGGRVGKGKTVVNVVVSPQGVQQAPMPPQRVPVPVPVPGGAGAGAPPAPPIGGPSPMGGPAMPPPGMMGRKRGGRVGVFENDYCHGPENASTFGKQAGGENYSKPAAGKFGGGGGLGRLAKIKSEGAAEKKYASKDNY